jgi:hypothetical protein
MCHTCISAGRPALHRRYQPQRRLEEKAAEEARADEGATGSWAAAGSSRIQNHCERERSCDGNARGDAVIVVVVAASCLPLGVLQQE